jgi:hypothetical protein
MRLSLHTILYAILPSWSYITSSDPALPCLTLPYRILPYPAVSHPTPSSSFKSCPSLSHPTPSPLLYLNIPSSHSLTHSLTHSLSLSLPHSLLSLTLFLLSFLTLPILLLTPSIGGRLGHGDNEPCLLPKAVYAMSLMDLR